VIEPLLTARQVGEALGLSASTVLDWWEQGKLPGFRLSSRAVRFRESEVLAWLEERRVAPRDVVAVTCDRPEGGVR
jgi:excisionase family DNA binding protein